MFLGLIQSDPYWLLWMAAFNLVLMTILYGRGELVIVYKDRYYGATTSKAIADVTELYME
ncbi:hypothetical protein NYE69_26260 [Paenibacillus sp. FSL R5-0527]|uniref:hypothetical protein n=1 Tax=Paenibacillus sp. FSL R5-0527 TaxID=2975321 RepID=UPI00097A4CD7|nr:hypothetical protein BK140_10380 [Paenibacillus macerans]